jgi:hypothetical protein
MRLLLRKGSYDTPRGPRYLVACRLEASAEEVAAVGRYAPKFRFGTAGDVWDLLDHEVIYHARDLRDVVRHGKRMTKTARKLGRRLEVADRFEGEAAVQL